MKTFEAREPHVQLPIFDYAIVVTGVEVLESPEHGWLVAVRGCMEQWRIFDDGRIAMYPMHLWVPPRQNVWFGIQLMGHDRKAPVVRMRIHYRAAEPGDAGSGTGRYYERKLPEEL